MGEHIIPKDISILVVDDMPNMRDFLKSNLVEMGYMNTVYANNGVEAYNTFVERKNKGVPFQFVLSDWHMPEMTGLDLLKKLRGDPANESLPIVLVTSQGDMPEVMKAIVAGVSNYILKPFDVVSLSKKMEEAWKKHHNSKP